MKCLKSNPLQLERFNEFLEISKALDKNGKIFKSGDNNAETAEWLWRKANKGKPFDLSHEMIETVDLKRYKREVKNFINNYGKAPGFFSRYFKLPKALVRNIQGGEEFYNNVAETMSFHQRQTKESAQHIQSMIDGLYTMIGTEGWGARDFKKFQQLERNLIGAKTPEQKKIYEIYEDARAQILDRGNTQIRNLEAEFVNYDIVRKKHYITLPVHTGDKDDG